MRLNDMKISTRLSIAFGVITLLIVAFGFSASQVLNGVLAQWDNFSTHSLHKREIATEGQIQLGNTIHHFKNFILRGGDYDTKFFDGLAEIDAAVKKYRDTGKLNPRENELLESISSATRAYKDAMKKVREMKMDSTDVQTIDKSIKGADKPIAAAFSELLSITMEETKETSHAFREVVKFGKKLIVAANAVAIALAIICAWAVSRSISLPLAKAVKIAQTVAAGDLTSRIEVTHQDETGMLLQALKEMNDSLAKIAWEVRSGTSVIGDASRNIASGNLDLSSRTEEQASSLEETAASIEELTEAAIHNAENAKQASLLASSAADVAVRGGEIVFKVVDTMSSISESSKKIVDIIGVIDGIAFQTNILALNAAVEAARAGEQGRGFAVVAAEVRGLAQRSASAAKEIKVLINDSVQKVGVGAELVDKAGTTMEEVVISIKRVTDLLAAMATASQEESAGIAQINKAVTQIDEVTQQNAALVEEVAAASDSLQGQASVLEKVVSVFKLPRETFFREKIEEDTLSAKTLSELVPPTRKIRQQLVMAES